MPPGGQGRAVLVRRSPSGCPESCGGNRGRSGRQGETGLGPCLSAVRAPSRVLPCEPESPSVSGVALAVAGGEGSVGTVPAGSAAARLRAPHGNGQPRRCRAPARPRLGASGSGVPGEKTLRSCLRNYWKLRSIGAGLVSEKMRALPN